MYMHLAQHSDLAMHTVLAIVANQVRSERNNTFFLATGIHPVSQFVRCTSKALCSFLFLFWRSYFFCHSATSILILYLLFSNLLSIFFLLKVLVLHRSKKFGGDDSITKKIKYSWIEILKGRYVLNYLLNQIRK